MRELHRFDRRPPRLRVVDGAEAACGGEGLGEVESGAAERIRAAVAASVGGTRFDRYFAGQALVEVKPGTDGAARVDILAASSAVANLIERRFGAAIRSAVIGELGDAAGVVIAAAPARFGPASAGEAARTERPPAVRLSDGGAPEAARPAERRREVRGAASAARLEDFVVGESNRLAYAAALHLTEPPEDAQRYSPLLIHGPCGVGKTHLLQGIAQRLREMHPGAVIRSVTGEAFMNEFVAAIRAGGAGKSSVEAFRRQFRRCDLLCIDDVHFLASKAATQQELLHTFDEISTGGARIALACDRHPRQIRQFSPALASRLVAGMVAEIEPPDATVRERAMRLFAQRRGLRLDEAALRLLVERTTSVPGSPPVCLRDIEGLITRIDALQRLSPGMAGGEGGVRAVAVEQALRMTSSHGGGGAGGDGPGVSAAGASRRPVRVEHIIAKTCDALGVDTADLAAPTRHKRVVLARAVITHLARQMTTMSFPEIARAIGRPSHSTVITAHQRLERQIAAGEVFGIGPSGESMTVGGLVRHLAAALAARA